MESCASFRAGGNPRGPFPPALPASGSRPAPNTSSTTSSRMRISPPLKLPSIAPPLPLLVETLGLTARGRSEEHTSELQSRLHLVCRLLLEKKKNDEQINRSLRLVHQ